jgi:hypothetical protein
MSEKRKVTPDLYLLRFIYDNHKYGFITISDLQKEIGWDRLKLVAAMNSIRNWGFAGDQRYGEVICKPGLMGTGICLDEKYATVWFFDNECPKLEEMQNPYPKEK